MGREKNIHIGRLIKEKFEERQKSDKTLTITSFAKRIHIHRSTLYLLFKQKSIDIELLMTISKVLNYSFIEKVYLNKPVHVTGKNQVFVGVAVDVEKLSELSIPDPLICLLPVAAKE